MAAPLEGALHFAVDIGAADSDDPHEEKPRK
jgi:hypothetical protein